MKLRSLMSPLWLVFVLVAEVVMWAEYSVDAGDVGGFGGGFVLLFTGQAWVAHWCEFALLEGLLGLSFIGVMVLSGFAWAKTPAVTFLWAALALAGLLVAQLVADWVASGVLALHQLSFTTGMQLAYYAFAAPVEETCFRGLLLGVALSVILNMRLRKSAKFWAEIIAVVAAAVLFAAIHVNYYGNLPELLGTFASGCVLGGLFVWLVQMKPERGGDVLVLLLLAHLLENLAQNWTLLVALI